MQTRLKYALLPFLLGGWMMQLHCARIFQREIEVLRAPEANPLLVSDSVLVNIFGPGILRLFD